jgi:hypothetical protein
MEITMPQHWQLALAIFGSILFGKAEWGLSEFGSGDDLDEPTTGHAFIGLGDSFDDDRRRVRLP